MTVLDQLRNMSVIVADTGETEAVKRLRPVDCTTNPSLVLGRLQTSASQDLIAREIAAARTARLSPEQIAGTLTVAIGAELTQFVSGRVSTEVDACLSFDEDASVQRAHDIIADYAKRGINKDRILIKLAATWEGIRAAERLQAAGIDCNLTLLFCMAQAVACADANVFLISPFVGRISDWYKAHEGKDAYAPDEDPGVLSVKRIYNYYKSQSIATVVMGASFRNTGQIKALAGCDRLTIAPKLLDALAQDESDLPHALSPQTATHSALLTMDEAQFRWEMNADAMATEKLAEGIRKFHADHVKLIEMVSERMG